MFGKHFESMYKGSMYGAGLAVFAVWGYVISNVKRGRIEINPQQLADTLGGEVHEVEEALEWLMQPDKRSRNKEHDGRRLVKEGEFQYFVPSAGYYRKIRDEEERRIYNREKQREIRAKKKERNTPSAREQLYDRTGDESLLGQGLVEGDDES